MEYEWLTDFSLFYSLAHPSKIGIEAPVKAYLQLHACAFHGDHG